MTDEDKLLSPEDFEEDATDESTDGKGDENKDKSTKSNSDDSDEKAKTQQDEDEQKKKEEQHRRNEEFKARRLAKEKKEREEREKKIKEDAELSGKLSVLKENPYTHEKIEDADDLRIYEIQKQLDDEGLDAIEDLPKRLAEIYRKERQQKEQENKANLEQQEKLKKDVEDFRKVYPNVNIEELANNDEYIKYGEKDGRWKRWTMIEVYEGYLAEKERNSAKEKKAMIDKKADEVSKNMNQNPSSVTKGTPQTKSVKDMNIEEYKSYMKQKYGG